MKQFLLTPAAAAVILSVFLLTCANEKPRGPRPRAVRGIMDLSGWDLERDGVISLNGQWEFHWEKLLSPADFSREPSVSGKTYLDVPRPWNGAIVDGNPVPGRGFATYRLLVKLKSPGRMLGLKINQVLLAYNVWADGRLIRASGRVGKNAAEMRSTREVTVSFFEPRSNSVELIIQASNFHYAKGGINGSIELGTAADIQRTRERRFAFDMFLFGSLLIMTFYHFGLYLFRRRDLYLLYFGLFCLLFAMRSLHVGEISLTALLPGFDWEVMLRWELITVYLLAPVSTMFYHSLYAQEISRHVLRAVQAVAIAAMLATLVVPPEFINYIHVPFLLFMLLLLCYLVALLATAAAKGRDGALLFLIGFIFPFVTGANDILLSLGLLRTPQLIHFGFFLFVFSQSIALSRRFAHALTTVETQRRDLTETTIALAQEVAERKRMEDALSASREFLDKIINSIGDPIFVKDGYHRFVLVNDALCTLAGHAREDILGKTDYEFFPKEQVDGFWHTDDEVLSTGNESIIEEQITGEHGDVRTILTRKSLFVDSAGGKFIVGVIRDITDRKKAEDALREYQERLEDLVAARTAELMNANVRLQQEIVERKRAEQELLKASKIESLGIFAGGIAHDFNNLLTAIMGNISLARANTDPGNPNYTILAEAESASMKTKDLTHQLLTFSKGGAPIKQATSVESLLRDTADFVLRGSTIRCRYRIPEDLWNAEVDAGQFSQVVHNIVINARQAMPGGGELSIEARNVPAGEIRLLPLPAGNYIAITIADTGGGIPEEHLHKIFDPYFTTKEHGNGLGLAITYSIIRNHGGYITAESLPGGGAAFTIYLPSSDRPASPSDKAAEEEFTGRGRILVMDDEEFVLKVASKMIEKLGFIPVPASNGDEAIELCRSAQREGNPFDAVIMDLTVPGGMGGKETMSRLKEIFPGIKAIVSSGYSEDPIMANYESYGFSGVLVKPYRFEELAAALRRLLG